ncbi:methyl-accepting chemotaxis protein [Sedimentibacter acidaminivorans]|uniref:Methyl-accepting chemotaxis protein n=1 Tax=Sedimentibacter acidaminivorans TaxID=913099 RepID=A0ABS4GD39_9FIRM|nr:methyl-accepting chemotaxis protein [Sedimentibacter acidaminivorans]MBP1925610.1 methyl-accepting chemotaxis protein [Sedimentibacter acidaminivorans]
MMLISRKIGERNHIVSGINEVNAGNLSKKFVSRGLRFKGLAEELNKLLLNYRRVLANVGMNSDTLYNRTKKLSAITVKTSSAMREIAMTVEKIALGAQRQNEMSNKIVESSRKLVNIANETIDKVELTKNNLEQTVVGFRGTREVLQHLIEKMQNRSKENISLSLKTKEISEGLRTMNGIIDVVKNISKQTNLLALNASIEAARAGEQGKGFSVIASEIRELAQASNKSADEISEILNNFEVEIRGLINCFDDGVSQEQEDSKILSEVETGFSDIAEISKLTVTSMFQVCRDIELQGQEIENMNSNLIQITTASNEISGATQQVASVIEEQSNTLVVMAKEAESFEKMSETMTKVIKEHSQVKIPKETLNSIKNKWTTFVKNLVQNPDIIKLNGNVHTKLFKELSKKNNDKIVLYTYMPDSTRVGCNLDGIPPIDLRDRPWFIGALQGKTFVSDLYITTDTNEIVLTIASPIYNKNEVIAMLGLDVVIES